jgi:hypothetical protein
MPIPVTLKEIVAGIDARTRANRLQWRLGPKHTQVLVVLDLYSVVLEQQEIPRLSAFQILDPQFDQAMRLSLIGPGGSEIDSVVVAEGDDDYEVLRDTYERAKLVARGVRSDIERIEQLLRGLAS